jgi:protein subunit release factor B
MGKELVFSLTKKDFEITWFSGRGAGGQYRNRHKNCCRIKHIETGIIGTGQSQRSQEQNRKEAFMSLTNNKKFKAWLNIKTSAEVFDLVTVLRQVDEAMDASQLKFEFMRNGEWVEV